MPDPVAKTVHPKIAYLCHRFIARASELVLRGKKRDEAAIHFFVGAANALDEGSEEQRFVLAFLFSLQFRGYAQVEEGAKTPLLIEEATADVP